MKPTFAAELRQTANNLQAVRDLYAPLAAVQDRRGVIADVDIPYGYHSRHVMDIYRPETSAGRLPVIVFLHGGGFIQGDKSFRANLGYFFAQQGFVTVVPNYRLAPEYRWPSGAEDVIAIWNWLQGHGEEYGGNADRVVLGGESAGAAHVAAAVLRAEFQPVQWKIAGAMLLSGVYNARLEGLARKQLNIPTPDPRNEAYFGADLSSWGASSTVEHVSVSPFPLWISYSELDFVQMQIGAGELFARLVGQHGFQPDLHVLPYHNHYSPGHSLGTDDITLSAPLLDFLRRITLSQA